MKNDGKIFIRFWLSDGVLAAKYIYNAPRMGEFVKIDGTLYAVEEVVWCYDEPELNYERLNVGIAEVE